MRTETVTFNIYTFDELSEKAKEVARENWRTDELYYDDWDAPMEDSKNIASCLGIDIDDIFFSGFSHQGDGALFVGSYSYRDDWKTVLLQNMGGDELPIIMAIGQQLEDAHNKTQLTGMEVTTSQTDSYCHSGCMDVNVNFDDCDHLSWQDQERMGEEFENEVKEALRSFADWIYSNLENHYNFRMSDEAVDESISINECEFTESGKAYSS